VTIATEALDRVHGTARVADGSIREFSIFVKQLRSARLWPYMHLIPPEHRSDWMETFPWRIELDALTSPLADLMPLGFRMPRLYEIVQQDPDRAAIWMEDVETDAASHWTPATFVRAARSLGELAGRRPITSDTCLGQLEMYRTPGLALRMFVAGRIAAGVLPSILEDAPWRLRRLDGDDYADLRVRLRRAAGEIDQLLDLLERLPQAYPHGDASPQNLLIPVDDPQTFVVIDWGFNSPQAVGFDLGQLLIGLVNDDEISLRDLPSLDQQVVSAYTDGLRAAGFEATEDEVRQGYALSAAIRSMFTALDLDQGPPDETWTPAHQENRVQLVSYLLDLCEQYAPSST
jgi:hypothetical protein